MHPGNKGLTARVKAAYASDAASAACEYGAEFRSVLSGFLSRDLIEQFITAGVTAMGGRVEIHGRL